MKSLTTLILSLSFAFSFSQDVELELFASNLISPVNIKHAGDDRLFVAERDGLIKIVNLDGSVENTPFLDIDNLVSDDGGESGLLGLAFHPNYGTNGYFFVNYINNFGDTVVSRFSRNEANPSIADSNSELIIINIIQPFNNHNGGDLAFGPDGYLYIATGDGGDSGDPQNNSQNLNILLGKLLRLDVNNSSIAEPYLIPADNPFVGNSSAADEIWAYGLRNPWKFSFDSMNGDLWIGDVGEGEIEEINRVASTEAGLNYGWRCYEGSSAFNTSGCPNSSTLTFPIAEYNHNDGEFKCSVIGGYRYRGSNYPNFEDLYFFADFCSGEIGYTRFENNTWPLTLKDFTGNWSTFGEDSNGELFIANINGTIFKLTDALLSIEEDQFNSISIFPNPAEDQFQVDFTNSNTAASTEINIYDIQGKVIKMIKRNTEVIQTIRIDDIISGLYILQIESDGGQQFIKKLIIN